MNLTVAREIATLLDRRAGLLDCFDHADCASVNGFGRAVDLVRLNAEVRPHILACLLKQIAEVNSALVERGIELDAA